jgi:hypothetical protein
VPTRWPTVTLARLDSRLVVEMSFEALQTRAVDEYQAVVVHWTADREAVRVDAATANCSPTIVTELSALWTTLPTP